MLKQDLQDINLEFDELFFTRIKKFKTLLKQWGKIHNLTASLEDKQIDTNIIDSLYPLNFIDKFESLLDVGTGAGYPGMILAIAKPNTKVTLVEPRTKRVAFLNFVKNSLGLKNITVVEKRVENLESAKYDIITSRAVTNISLLLDITKNLNVSYYLFYKGSLCDSEIKEAQIDNYKIVNYKNHRNYLYIKEEKNDI